MNIAVVIIHDRHSDTTATLFADADDAIAWARERVREYAGYNNTPKREIDEELTGPMRQGGWLYYGRYSGEGDCVRVEMATLHQKGETPL